MPRFSLMLITVKICLKCRSLREISRFGKDSSRADGLHQWCKDCMKAHNASRRVINAQWRNEHAQELREYAKRYHVANAEKIRKRVRDWRTDNHDQSASNARTANYRATKRNATPAWANLDAIKALYAEAARLTRETGIAHDVDHIVPLKSKLVCGLHCEANLQILTSSENKRKLNVYWPDMP